MIRTRILVAALAALALSAGIASATTYNVSITDNIFTPSTTSVRPGDVVHWTNNGAAQHTVTSGTPGAPGQVFNVTLNPGQTFDWTVGTPPVSVVTLNYQCNFHVALGMKGKLKITR